MHPATLPMASESLLGYISPFCGIYGINYLEIESRSGVIQDHRFWYQSKYDNIYLGTTDSTESATTVTETTITPTTETTFSPTTGQNLFPSLACLVIKYKTFSKTDRPAP